MSSLRDKLTLCHTGRECPLRANQARAAAFLPMTGSPLSCRPAGVRLVWPGRDLRSQDAGWQVRDDPALPVDASVRPEISVCGLPNIASERPFLLWMVAEKTPIAAPLAQSARWTPNSGQLMTMSGDSRLKRRSENSPLGAPPYDRARSIHEIVFIHAKALCGCPKGGVVAPNMLWVNGLKPDFGDAVAAANAASVLGALRRRRMTLQIPTYA